GSPCAGASRPKRYPLTRALEGALGLRELARTMTLRERSVDSMSWMSADRLLRWATVAPLTIAGVATAAAGAYLDLLAAAAFAKPPAGALVPPTRRLVVLVPAHNEADFIGRCLETLHSQDYPPDLFEVAVIADN